MSRSDKFKVFCLCLVIFLLALVPRLENPDVFLNPDEHRWTERSVNFLKALCEGRMAGTFQVGYPGVITMELGSLGLIAKYLSAGGSAVEPLGTFLGAVPLAPLDITYLPAFRLPMTLLASLSIAIIYLLTVPLFGKKAALLSALLLVFDPFFLAHSRLFHVDTPLTVFMTFSVLTLILYVKSPRRKVYLLGSGLTAGLAVLGKSPALFLISYMALVLLLARLAQSRERSGPKKAEFRPLGEDLLIWVTIALLTFITFWPAMWIQPLETAWELWKTASSYGGQPHSFGNFFMGEPVNDPGLFFYPVSLAFRTTPLTLAGLSFTIGLFIADLYSRLMADRTAGTRGTRHLFSTLWGKDAEQSVLALLLYLASFTAFMTLAKKKFDRYLLPLYPTVDILAAWGWVRFTQVLKTKYLALKRTPAYGGLLVAAVLQAAFSLPHHPYYLTAYNPLLGGSASAPKVLLVGWGEGLDQAACFMNQREDATALSVATIYGPTLQPLLRGKAVNLWSRDNPWLWHLADYTLLYTNQVQRNIPNEAIVRYLRSLDPLHVVRLKGIDYAWIYETPEELPDSVIPAQHIQQVQFGDCLLLRGYDIYTGRVAHDGKLQIHLYWQGLCPMKEQYGVFLKLLNGARHIWGEQAGELLFDGLPTNQWGRGVVVRDGQEIEVLPGTLPGPYLVEIVLYDLDSGNWVPPQNEEDLLLGPVEMPRREVSTIEDLGIEYPLQAVLGGKIQLLGYNLESGFHPGDGIHLTLFWQALGEMDKDYTVFVHLVDEKDYLWGQKDNPPVDGFHPTTAWGDGEIVRDQYDLGISPDAPPGQYRIEVGMYLADTGERLPVLAEDGSVQGDKILLARVGVGVRASRNKSLPRG
jgi:4-amino-4-deoxy-L-arabinose transferase-like glycosyltransferase